MCNLTLTYKKYCKTVCVKYSNAFVLKTEFILAFYTSKGKCLGELNFLQNVDTVKACENLFIITTVDCHIRLEFL